MTTETAEELSNQFETEFWRGVALVICVVCRKQDACARDEILGMWERHVCGPVTAPWDAHEAVQ